MADAQKTFPQVEFIAGSTPDDILREIVDAEVVFGGYSLCLRHLSRVHKSDWSVLGVDVVIKGILDS